MTSSVCVATGLVGLTRFLHLGTCFAQCSECVHFASGDWFLGQLRLSMERSSQSSGSRTQKHRAPTHVRATTREHSTKTFSPQIPTRSRSRHSAPRRKSKRSCFCPCRSGSAETGTAELGKSCTMLESRDQNKIGKRSPENKRVRPETEREAGSSPHHPL